MTGTQVLDARPTAVILPFRPASQRFQGSRLHRKRAAARAAARLRAAHEFSGSDNVVVLAEAKRRFTRLDGGDAA